MATVARVIARDWYAGPAVSVTVYGADDAVLYGPAAMSRPSGLPGVVKHVVAAWDVSWVGYMVFDGGSVVEVEAFGPVGASAADLALVQAKTDTLGTGTVTVVSPVASDLTVTLVRGDDYQAADGRALDFTNADGTWPDLTGATVSLGAGRPVSPPVAATSADSFTGTGSVVTPAGDDQEVRIELTAADTKGKTPGWYRYDVQAVLSGGSVVTLVRGRLNLVEDQAD